MRTNNCPPVCGGGRLMREIHMELIGKQIAIETILGQPPELHYPSWYAAQIEKLPSAPPEYLAEQAGILVADTDTISRQAAIDALWAERMKHDEEMERNLETCSFALRADNKARRNRVEEDIEIIRQLPPAQPERTCVNCGRTVNNGGWYADGRTRCPIEEHYALPKDGYCHLWEKRNVTDDDYPERRTDE